VLLTGFGRSLSYQYVQQPGFFDFLPRGFDPLRQDFVVLVVSHLSTVMYKLLNKPESIFNVCILQSIAENESKQKVKTIPKIKCM